MLKEKGLLSAASVGGLMALAFVLLVLRRPDIITHAQPWAEDGKIWMAGIYNDGFWSSLLLPQNGYYQTISRIAYGVSLVFGLEHAALGANLIALLIRCCFVGFLLSSRMNYIPVAYRLAAAAYFVLMPNLSEGFVNITNSHWYLSMYLVAVVMAEKPESISWKIHDYGLLILSSLSGPFVVFIAPCLFIKRVYERGGVLNAIKGINAFDLIMASCCVIQVAAILSSPDTARSSAPLGASIGVLIKIVSYRIIAGTFLPNDAISFIPFNKWLCLALFLLFIIPAVYYFFRAGWRYKIALIFPTLMIGFALAKPMMSITDPQWPVFFIPGSGERYFFVTNFAFFCFILFMISKAGKAVKFALPALCLFTLLLVSRDFRMQPYADVGFAKDISEFSSLPEGQVKDIHINPPGWIMTLHKK